ncbi:hypothetical protein [Marinilactibacillus kalidii]|uniref:hypothetical protein n=1 Tax=Marinilactibacillus kalidii TaxID=2820274 RepID=UPI001ABEAC94|nr:hypothetical protein [Marinilactibacillus kalidii]
MENVKRIPLSVKAFAAGLVVLSISYLMTFAMPFDFGTFIMCAAAILTVLVVIFSGTAVSGDRMRANNYSTKGKNTQFVKVIFLFAIPFYICFLILEFL